VGNAPQLCPAPVPQWLPRFTIGRLLISSSWPTRSRVLSIPPADSFFTRYFRATTHLELRESQCLQLWDEILTRRRELTDTLGRPISLKTVLMDVLSSSGLVRVPVILEYDELKKIQLNAVTDPLTGLYNRRLFAESFEKGTEPRSPLWPSTGHRHS